MPAQALFVRCKGAGGIKHAFKALIAVQWRFSKAVQAANRRKAQEKQKHGCTAGQCEQAELDIALKDPLRGHLHK